MKKFRIDSYEDLIEDISNGNEVAFSRFYDYFYPSLLKYVSAKINVQSSAEDILHDLFLSIWINRGKITSIESIPAYLYSSCRYLTIQHIKNTSVWNTNQDVGEVNVSYQEVPLEDRLYFRYLLDIVNEEIESLPEKCREIFKMSRNEFKSNKEIAKALGISESTVENQINKALKRIRYIAKDLFLFIVLFYRL